MISFQISCLGIISLRFLYIRKTVENAFKMSNYAKIKKNGHKTMLFDFYTRCDSS